MRVLIIFFVLTLSGCTSVPDGLPASPAMSGQGMWVPWWLVVVVWIPLSVILVGVTYWLLSWRDWHARALLSAMGSLLLVQGMNVGMRVSADLELADGGFRFRGEHTVGVTELDWWIVAIYGVGMLGLIAMGLRKGAAVGGSRSEEYIVDGRLSPDDVFDYLVTKTCSLMFCRPDVRRLLVSGEADKLAKFVPSGWRWLVHLRIGREAIQRDLAGYHAEFMSKLAQVRVDHPLQATSLVIRMEHMVSPPDDVEKTRVAELISQALTGGAKR